MEGEGGKWGEVAEARGGRRVVQALSMTPGASSTLLKLHNGTRTWGKGIWVQMTVV